MKNTKFKLSALALSIGLAVGGMGTASDAEAGVLGTAILEISNFLIINEAGNFVGDRVTINTDNRNGEMTVILNGTSISDGYSSPIGSTAATIDLDPLWLGMNPLGNNSTTVLPDGTGTFSRADMYVTGAVFGTGGQGFVRSDTYSITEGTSGNSIAGITNNVTAEYSFTVGPDGLEGIGFTLDADLYLEAFVSSDLYGTYSAADAATNFGLTVFDSDKNEILTWSPQELSREVSADGSDPDFASQTIDGSFTGLVSNFIDLNPGKYRVVITQKSSSHQQTGEATEVPEPGIIALLSLGLLGIGINANSRRKIK